MMSRVFTSVLGTGKYVPCNYRFEDKTTIEDTAYIQEAAIRHYCAGWDKTDTMKIFVTDAAYRKNWVGEDNTEQESLLSILQRMSREDEFSWIVPEDICVRIPTVKKNEDILKIFNIIFEALPKDSAVILDITHSFRYLPMLLMSIISYARYLKNITVKRVLYGAVEVLGPVNEVRDMNIEERTAPVLDLTGLIDILSWTESVRDFTKFGNADLLNKMIKEQVAKESKRSVLSPYLKHYSRIGRFLRNVSNNIHTVRGEDIYSSFFIEDSFDVIREENNNIEFKPLLPLMETVEEKISGLKENSLNNGIIAAQWCYDYNMIEQGFTILQETFISMLCDRFGMDYTDKGVRDIVSQALIVKYKRIPEEKWKPELQSFKRSSELVLFIEYPMAKWYKSFSGLRNNLNHAGIGKNKTKAETFKEKLREGIEFVSSLQF